eukprot:Pgem_evm1s9919
MTLVTCELPEVCGAGDVDDVSCSGYDVIIVGAGLSGLTCAYRLAQKSAALSILVLEANNRVGGRTYSENCKILGDFVLFLYDNFNITATHYWH